MATEKQMQANRANARKSTGPHSMEGKSMSSKNSLKHGLLSQGILLPNEDSEEYQALSYDLWQYFQPIGRWEEELVAMIVAAIWRLRRVNWIEASILTRNIFLKKAERARHRASSFEIDSLTIEPIITDRLEHRKAEKEAEEATKQATSDSALIGGAFLQDVEKYNGILKLSRYATAIQRDLIRTRQQLDQSQARRRRTPDSSPGILDIELSQSQTSTIQKPPKIKKP